MNRLLLLQVFEISLALPILFFLILINYFFVSILSHFMVCYFGSFYDVEGHVESKLITISFQSHFSLYIHDLLTSHNFQVLAPFQGLSIQFLPIQELFIQLISL